MELIREPKRRRRKSGRSFAFINKKSRLSEPVASIFPWDHVELMIECPLCGGPSFFLFGTRFGIYHEHENCEGVINNVGG